MALFGRAGRGIPRALLVLFVAVLRFAIASSLICEETIAAGPDFEHDSHGTRR
jgi:hypothetical protein